MKINDCSKFLQLLIKELSDLQKLVNTFSKSKAEGNSKRLLVNQIIKAIQDIKALAEEAKAIKSVILLDQDFTRFCILLIDGSDMADYLLDLDGIPERLQKQAASWKRTAATFKPFLKNSIYNKANSGNLSEISS